MGLFFCLIFLLATKELMAASNRGPCSRVFVPGQVGEIKNRRTSMESEHQGMVVIRKSWGTVGIQHPNIPDKGFILVLPGYTGDALSHANFIEAAVAKGFGIVAVTPLWAKSVSLNISRAREAIQDIGDSISLQSVRIVRANSFGVYLTTNLLDLLPNVGTAIFITPCSGNQLYQARTALGLDVTMDFRDVPRGKLRKSIVYLVNDDSIVPSLDPYFRDVMGNATITVIAGDHFTVSEQQACCIDALNWVEEN
jgi:hypothetical protein